VVKQAGQQQGYAARKGEAKKDDAWLCYTEAQGDFFRPICHESAGTIGESALALLEILRHVFHHLHHKEMLSELISYREYI